MGAVFQFYCLCHWNLDQQPDKKEEDRCVEEEGEFLYFLVTICPGFGRV